MKTLQQIIDESRRIVFFGGAGVSTESGIPDFRSVDGLYNQKYDVPPETILSHTYFVRHTQEFFRFYREKMLCLDTKPNKAHLKLAEMEEREPQLNAVRYIAINPPVSTEYALRQIDQLINVSAKWSKSEMLTRLYDNAGRMFINLSRRYQHFDPAAEAVKPWSYQVPLDKDTARYIVGLSLKLSMRELLLAQHMETPLENFPEYAWNKRNELYMEIDRVTFAGYAEKLLHPRYPGKSMAELLAASDLHSLEKTLKNSSKVRVLHTLDDFLVSEKDRKFLDSALKDRISWFSNGGHLGSLYYRSASDAVVNAASY